MFIRIDEKRYENYMLYTLIDSDFQTQYTVSYVGAEDVIKADIINIIKEYSIRNLNVGKNLYLYFK